MEITEGMRVCFSRNFLSITCQHTGEPAPTNIGPFAEGVVKRLDTWEGSKTVMAMVLWDNGEESMANVSCLWDATKKHMEPA